MDWSKAKPGVADRVVQEGETYLSAQLQLATSGDQRASMLAGVFTAAGAAFFAAVVALFAATDISVAAKYPMYLGGVTVALLFLIGASYCVAATLPVGMWLPGNQPDSWFGDVEAGKELVEALGEEAENIQSKVAENRDTLKANASRFRTGAILGITAPFFGLLVWAAATFFVRVAG